MSALPQLEEDECVARAQRGDVAAFSELVARYQNRIYRFLVRLTRSPDDALELTQETFLNAYQALARWRPEARFTTWLFRIARNQAIDWLRRTKRVEFVALEEGQDLHVADSGPRRRPRSNPPSACRGWNGRSPVCLRSTVKSCCCGKSRSCRTKTSPRCSISAWAR